RGGGRGRGAPAASAYSTGAGSGVPNVGAPDCIDIDEANEPNTTGAPGRTSWTYAIPAIASASVWVAAPAAVAGDMAPARMNGVIITAWLASAYARAAPSIVESHTSGLFALIRLRTYGRCSNASAPNRIRAISTVSRARSGCVTEPMNGLSEYRMCA